MDFGSIFNAANNSTLVAVAGVLCGVALLHLVIIRTIRRRKNS